MADLMTGTVSYKKLADQYGNFMVPAAKIKVNGSDTISSLGLLVHELTITLSVKAAGTAEIVIAGVYDVKSHSFQSDVKNKFKPGTIVEIELGYLSSLEKVFKGYVYSIGARFTDGAYLVLTLLDVRRLMMDSGQKQMLYDSKNYSDVFKTVMNQYAKLCSTKIDTTDDKLEYPVSQTASDYLFVTKELTRKSGREFFVFADKAYFVDPEGNNSPAISLEYGRELLEFHTGFAYVDLQAEVSGYSKKEQKNISIAKKAKGTVAQAGTLMEKKIISMDPDADTEAKARIRAESIVLAELKKACKGNGVTVGLPQIVPGRYVKVESMDSLFNKKYYVEEVTHVIDEEKFHTYFDIGGCVE